MRQMIFCLRLANLSSLIRDAYLIAVRELRTKQSLFKESFVTDISLRLNQSQFQTSGLESTLPRAELGAAFERVEIDLASR